jgi:hypothetical protein
MRTSARGKSGGKPRTAYLEINFWPADSGSGIFVTSADWSKPVLIRQDGRKLSGHEYLWPILDGCLKKAGIER